MKYLSLFSGIGGFELGIKQSYEKLCNNEYAHKRKKSKQKECPQRGKRSIDKHEVLLHSGNRTAPLCIGYSEIDKYAIQIYEKHFKHKNYGNITTIQTKQLPDFDLLVGGFPCQSFSIAGKRKGFDDTRGTLFFDIARILADKRPEHLVLENVKGLLSHDKGKTFTTILGVLTDLGYLVEWQVLNSKNFGVPQNRERVFIIGHLGKGSRPKVFPITGTNGKDIKVSGILDTETWKKRHESIRRVHDINGISPTIPTGTGGGVMTKIEIIRGRPKYKDGKRGLKWYKYNKTCPAITTNVAAGDQKNIVVQPVLTPDRLKKRQNGRRFKENGDPSFTLTGQDKHGVMLDSKIRRLTPTECERLQGFPDGWTEGVSDTQRYKTLGNAVTVNVIMAIMKRLKITNK